MPLVGKESPLVETLKGLACGFSYGVTSAIVGHPIDTVKSIMQARGGAYANLGAIGTARRMIQTEGMLSLYRGFIPPTIGSVVFRSLQFSIYAGTYRHLHTSETLTKPIPGLAGLQGRVVVAGVLASAVRAIIEAPLERIKVLQQIGRPPLLASTLGGALRQPIRELRNMYVGFGLTLIRTTGLLTTFFMMADHLDRHAPQLTSHWLWGPFFKGGLAATFAWWLCWPFELLKNVVQAEAGEGGAHNKRSLGSLMREIVRERGGVAGLYRGLGPGTARSMFANGISMSAFATCQKYMKRDQPSEDR